MTDKIEPVAARPQPPIAPVRPHRIEQLGRVRIDEYAWMKDANWREVLRDPAAIKPEVKNYLEIGSAACRGRV